MTKKINPFDEVLTNSDNLYLPIAEHLKRVANFATVVLEDQFCSEQSSMHVLLRIMMETEGWEESSLGNLITDYVTSRMDYIDSQREKIMGETDMLKISMKEVVVH